MSESATGPSAPPVRRSGVRRVGVAAIALAAAATLAGCAHSGGVSTPTPPSHTQTISVTRQGAWHNFDGDYNRIARLCDTTTNATVYATEQDRGGGDAVVEGCATDQPNFGPTSPWINVDGDYNRLATVCDISTRTLLYVGEMDRGGGVAAVPGGCGTGSATPGQLSPLTGWQNVDGDYYRVRVYRDNGTGNILYVSESDRGGGIAVVTPDQQTGKPGAMTRLSSWAHVDGDYTLVGKFCDMGTGTLVYVGETDRGGSVAALPGGCAPVADGQFPVSSEKGDPHISRVTGWTDFDGDYNTIAAACDGDNGARLILTESDWGGGVALQPRSCAAAGVDGPGS